MRYRIVTDGGRGKTIVDDIDMLIRHVRGRGWHFDGIYENSQTRVEIQGHPIVRELDGPLWWEEGDCVMYEEKGLVLQSAMARTGAKVITAAAPWGARAIDDRRSAYHRRAQIWQGANAPKQKMRRNGCAPPPPAGRAAHPASSAYLLVAASS
jgi:hypothetical protein